MNPLIKAINMVLRGNKDVFKTILEEALEDRASSLLEQIYKENSKNILKELASFQYTDTQEKPENVPIDIPASFTTKDGIFINLTPEQVDGISKLYENLNNNSKERLLKLLTESGEAVNRILNLSKIERKTNVK